MSCQTTHQLRRLADRQIQAVNPQTDIQVPSGLFDWLICPPTSIIKLLNDDIPDYNKNSIQILKDRPYWANYNLFFWHSFTVDHDQNRRINIDETFDKEKERWFFLRKRFSQLLPEDTVFVISNTQNNLTTEVYDESEFDQLKFTADVIEELKHSLARYFNTTVNSIHLEVVTRENRSFGLQNQPMVTFFPVDQNQWKGSKKSWNLWWQNLYSSLNR